MIDLARSLIVTGAPAEGAPFGWLVSRAAAQQAQRNRPCLGVSDRHSLDLS